MSNHNEIIMNRFNQEYESWNDRYSDPYKDTISYSIFRRRQLIMSELESILENNSSYRILEIGCGTANLAQQILERWPTVGYQGLDISSEMIKHNSLKLPNAKFAVCNIDKDQIQTKEKFDIVIMAGVIGYCNNIPSVLNKIKSVMNNEGTYIFSFGNKSSPFRRFRNLGIEIATIPLVKNLIQKLYSMDNSPQTLNLYKSYTLNQVQQFLLEKSFNINKTHSYSFSSGLFKRVSVKIDILLERFLKNKIVSKYTSREILITSSIKNWH